MEEVIREYLESAKFGRKQVYKNMAVFPLLSEYSLSLEYMLLDEALAARLVEVTEVDNHGAVPNLKVHNRSPRMVLILDGEELVGAKQNRIVNTTILVAGNATVIIPVSCVEQGRWAYNTPRFHSEERIMPSRMLAMKARQVQESVRSHGKYRADQSAIWADISERASRRDAASPSMAMAGIYEKDLPSLQEYLRHFSLIGSQVGAVPFFDKRSTVSGISRSEQRSAYDQRRRDVLPTRGVNLIEFSINEFPHDGSKRLLRDVEEDKRIIFEKLKDYLKKSQCHPPDSAINSVAGKGRVGQEMMKDVPLGHRRKLSRSFTRAARSGPSQAKTRGYALQESDFHTPIEKDCLDLLLRGRQPVVICPARDIKSIRLGKDLKTGIEEGRVLILSPFERMGRRPTAQVSEIGPGQRILFSA
jgi:hypothetical protein